MTCEEWRLAAMAWADGETPTVSRAAVEAHLATCMTCRREIAGFQELVHLWEGQRRPEYDIALWPKIENRLGRPKHYWLPTLVILLAAFKFADLVTERSLALSIRVLPVLMAAVVFAALRQNPFRIQTNLALKKKEL